MTSTTQTDSLVLAALVVGVLLAAGLVTAVRRLRPAAPELPPADRAPSGLGRLVPHGALVEAEVRRGLRELEHWLGAQRRTAP